MNYIFIVICFLIHVSIVKAQQILPPPSLSAEANQRQIKRTEDSTAVFEIVDVMPTFPGGINALMQYLGDHIIYPEKAVNYNIQGKVFVKFYIDTDGSVKDAVVIKDGTKGGGCAEEALRVINSMPNWTPGTQRGKPVKVYYTLPITFKLETNKQYANAVLIDSSIYNLGKYLFVYPKSDRVNYYAEMRFYISNNGNTDFVDVLQTNIEDEYLKTQLELQAIRAKWIPAEYGTNNENSSEVKTYTFNTVVKTNDDKIIEIKEVKNILDKYIIENLSFESIKTKLLKKHSIDLDAEMIEGISKIKTY